MSVFVCHPNDRCWLQPLSYASADALMTLRPDKVAAISLSTDTFAVNLDRTVAPDAPPQIFVKRYRYRSWGAILSGCWRGTVLGKSRAKLEFEVLSEMQRRGVRVVRPIAYAEQRRWGILHGCVLVTEAERNTETLSSYCLSHLSFWRPSTRRHFMQTIGQSVAGMHEAGVQHGGLFWRNILVGDVAENKWTLTYLDPNRRFRLYSGSAPWSARVSDLSDFIASSVSFLNTTDVARFLKSYAESCGHEQNMRSAIRTIIKLTTKKAAHESRRCVMETVFTWFQQRIQSHASTSNHPPFESLEAFISAIDAFDLPAAGNRDTSIRLKVPKRSKSEKSQLYDIVFDQGHVHVEREPQEKTDLLIRADTDTLLAVINSRPDALAAIQSGRIQLRGNVQALTQLTQLIDAQSKKIEK